MNCNFKKEKSASLPAVTLTTEHRSRCPEPFCVFKQKTAPGKPQPQTATLHCQLFLASTRLLYILGILPWRQNRCLYPIHHCTFKESREKATLHMPGWNQNMNPKLRGINTSASTCKNLKIVTVIFPKI